MIISVASGKGGTGKTTVATNLAFSISHELGEKIRLMDCDVEAPNAHLFLRPKTDDTREVFANVPLVDETRCNFCRKCMEICRFNAIAVMGKKKVLTFPELCHSCGGCMVVCPEEAISESPRVLGTIETGHAEKIEFIRGKLQIGQAMAPPIIKEIRRSAEDRKTTIIDAPPGTSCPVIAAMNGVDFIVLVTEPTPFGLHDLALAVEAVKLLNIPCGIVINRSTIGDNKVHEYAERKSVPILMEIPFDKQIAHLYSRGSLIAEELPEYQTRFTALYDKILSLLRTEKEGAA